MLFDPLDFNLGNPPSHPKVPEMMNDLQVAAYLNMSVASVRRWRTFRKKPPPIDHQGISDAMVGKASEVLYFYRGKWLRLSGDD